MGPIIWIFQFLCKLMGFQGGGGYPRANPPPPLPLYTPLSVPISITYQNANAPLPPL